jgi:hypothetical protein
VTVVKLCTNSRQCTFRSFACALLRTTLSGYAYDGSRLGWTWVFNLTPRPHYLRYQMDRMVVRSRSRSGSVLIKKEGGGDNCRWKLYYAVVWGFRRKSYTVLISVLVLTLQGLALCCTPITNALFPPKIILHICYEDEPVKVLITNRCLLWESYEVYKYVLVAKCNILVCERMWYLRVNGLTWEPSYLIQNYEVALTYR